MNKIYAKCIEMLSQGISASVVLAFLRTNYTKTCTLATVVSKIRRLFMKTEKRHKMYQKTSKRFLSVITKRKISKKCREIGLNFLNQSLLMQNKLLKTMKKKIQLKEFCFGHEDVNESFNNIKLLPNNVKYFKVSLDESLNCKDKNIKQREKRNRNMTEIFKGDELLEYCRDIIKNATVRTPLSKLAIALLLVCGRRLSELLNQKSVFTSIKEFPFACVFTGQLKTVFVPTYNIPLLIEFRHFEKAYKLLQQIQKSQDEKANRIHVYDIDNDGVNQRYNNNLLKALRRDKIFGSCIKNTKLLKIHLLRSIYVQMCYKAFDLKSNGDNPTLNIIAKSILGHQSLDYSLYYNTVELLDFQKNTNSLGTIVSMS